jgi:putative ABC transport system permease protein
VGNSVSKKLNYNKKKIIGTFILIKDKYYKIIGVLSEASILNQTVNKTIYLPINKNQKKINSIGVLFKSTNSISKTVDEIQNSICEYKGISSDEKEIIDIYNSNSQSNTINNLFNGITNFIWLIGISLLFVGMIGTSNIMLMKIKERQQEIAIRKALGAKSKIITSMILFESILITTIGGGIGIILGKILIYIINIIFIAPLIGNENFVFGLLEINNWAIFSVYIIIILSGIIGGIIPALKASKFSIVESINKDI